MSPSKFWQPPEMRWSSRSRAFWERGISVSARSVGSDWAANAEGLLRDKLRDPMAATLAGYLLLRAGEFSRLHDWTANLANWFGWLPDGPVIRAWHLMSKDVQEDGEIRHLLQKPSPVACRTTAWDCECYRVGSSFYTKGILPIMESSQRCGRLHLM